jgi:hypothetical protein
MPKDMLDDKTWRALRSVLDEEIGKLPENYQAAIVLCCLPGGQEPKQGGPGTGLAEKHAGQASAARPGAVAATAGPPRFYAFSRRAGDRLV